VIPLYKLLPKAHREALMLHRYFDHTRSITCDWVWGAYMLFPKTILDKMKGRKLAEDFFMYSEDVLWCWEIKNQGYDIYFLPEAKVMHINQASTSREKKELIRTTTIKNHAKFMRKYYPDWRWYVFASIYFAKQYSALLLGKLLKG
jgi:GT2 family glycosyltransferase